MKPLPLTLVRSIRFQAHPTETACWIWAGPVADAAKGPRITLDGKTTTARQALYRLVRGEPPARLRSRCGVRACINPHHMERATKRRS